MGATWGRHNSQISHVDHATTLIKPIKGERNRSSPAMLSFLYFLLLHIFFLSVPFYEIAPVLFSLCLAALTPYYHVPRVEGTDGHSPDHCPEKISSGIWCPIKHTDTNFISVWQKTHPPQPFWVQSHTEVVFCMKLYAEHGLFICLTQFILYISTTMWRNMGSW